MGNACRPNAATPATLRTPSACSQSFEPSRPVKLSAILSCMESAWPSTSGARPAGVTDPVQRALNHGSAAKTQSAARTTGRLSRPKRAPAARARLSGVAPRSFAKRAFKFLPASRTLSPGVFLRSPKAFRVLSTDILSTWVSLTMFNSR